MPNIASNLTYYCALSWHQNRQLNQQSLSHDRYLGSIIVIDLSGFSAFKHSGSDFRSRVFGLFEVLEHFGDSLTKCYIINAPTSFSIAWKVIKQVLHAQTVQRIKLSSQVCFAGLMQPTWIYYSVVFNRFASAFQSDLASVLNLQEFLKESKQMWCHVRLRPVLQSLSH